MAETAWVLLAGLPGTGKSTLAGALAARLDGVVLDKDRVRESLFPGAMTDYSREQDDLCVRAMLEAAEYLTTRHRTAFLFLDGRTFSRAEQIEEVLDAAEDAGAAWRIVHVTCADDVAIARLNQHDETNPARNRDAVLYSEIKNRFEAIAYPKLVVDTTGGVEEAAEAMYRYLFEPRS